MSRKILKSMERDGQRRRSPRISALDCKENHQKRQLCRTRSRMKRKADDSLSFSPVSKLAKQVWKGRDSPQNADSSTDLLEWKSVTTKNNQKCDDHHAITNGKQSIMPAKHVLELVLDTLQRRDSYEIFAEPVDPDEVEDYYEIIEEPMDFGTMRAKLHEGLYQNLQQFEHDVFLIPENAMHFNSSSTIYFRQARAIHDLAKKVFHVLKTDPENFVSEFSGTRRRSMRKALSESKDSRFVAPKSSDICSTSTFKRTNKKAPAMMDHFHARNGNTNHTFKESGILLSSSEVAERRLTYSCRDKVSVDYSVPYSSCKPLILMNQGDISYKESLMSFVKGLGSTAEKVAKRKLLGQHEEANKARVVSDKRPNSGCVRAKEFKTHEEANKARVESEKRPDSGGVRVKEFKTFRDFTGGNPFLKVIDSSKDGEWRGEKKGDENRGKEKSDENRGKQSETEEKSGKEKSDENRGKQRSETENDENGGKEKSEMMMMMKRVAFPLGKDLNCSTSKSNDDGRPVILALESAHSEFKSRIRRVSTQQQQPSLPIVSRFAFDLPFLKARLSQMTAAAVDRGGKLRC